jgi:glycosyltransferase involved in cell wall biosynthesis
MELKNKFDRSVSLLCWAYNEEDSIQGYLEKATRLMEASVKDYEIVLIDDGSADRTYEIAKAFQERNPGLKIFKNERNLNVGISSQRAIQRASKEFLFWQTIDWSYDISNLREYLEYLRTYDIVQGVRTKHLTRRSDTIPKAIVSVINFMLIRLLFRIPLSDFQNVTFYPTRWIQSIKPEAKSSFANPEGLIKSYWKGMSIKEVPINFIPRAKGKAKGTRLRAIVNSVKDILRLWFKWVILGGRRQIKKGRIYRISNGE